VTRLALLHCTLEMCFGRRETFLLPDQIAQVTQSLNISQWNEGQRKGLIINNIIKRRESCEDKEGKIEIFFG